MAFSLLPRIETESLTDLTPEILEDRGIRLLMLDFDNTIVPYTTNRPTPEMAGWIRTMLRSDVQICVVSNSKKPRVPTLCSDWGVPYITRAKKPFSRGIRQCLQRYGRKPSECALAGDQIFTDTLGANAAGLTSILVKPLHLHNIWLRLRHGLEKPFIFIARNRRITQ